MKNTSRFELATLADVDRVYALIKRFQHELGFTMRLQLVQAVERHELGFVSCNKVLAGAVWFRKRKDRTITIYEIVTDHQFRKQGIALTMLRGLLQFAPQIQCKCPVDLPANQFYQRVGKLVGTEPGKKRALNLWQITAETVTKEKTMPAVLKKANELQITYVPRKQIKFWKNNPRKNDRAAARVADLIRQRGMRSPINLWAKNMTVYKGNTTLKALDLIHGTQDYEVPCILHQFTSEAEAEAYGLSDNKASEFAEWDDDILAGLLASKDMKPFLAGTGFQEKEIANLLWIPDEARMSKVEETDSGMSARIMVFQVPLTDKEEIMQILKEWAANSGFEGIVIK